MQIQSDPNVSKNDLSTAAGFVDDSWRLNHRITLSLGLRLDRYQPSLPEQEGPAGQRFAAIAPVLTFNNWGPRVGVSTALTADGKTALKLHYGKYWVYPGVNFTSAFNPNPSGWSKTYGWTSDANGNGRWDPGEEGRLTSISGGSTSTRLDPSIQNTFVHQASAYIEREIAPDFGMRMGVVSNARRQPFGTINVSRPLSAYSVPVLVTDPGPDGRLGTADDGGTVAASNLAAEGFGVPPVNLTANLPDSGSDYYTWEVTATRRQTARWSLLASFAKTWSHEASLGAGSSFTPNAIINAEGGQDRFTTWQAKVNGTVDLPMGFRVVPVLRHQSGTAFARTFVQALNFGNAVIKLRGPVSSGSAPGWTGNALGHDHLVDDRVRVPDGRGDLFPGLVQEPRVAGLVVFCHRHSVDGGFGVLRALDDARGDGGRSDRCNPTLAGTVAVFVRVDHLVRLDLPGGRPALARLDHRRPARALRAAEFRDGTESELP